MISLFYTTPDALTNYNFTNGYIIAYIRNNTFYNMPGSINISITGIYSVPLSFNVSQ